MAQAKYQDSAPTPGAVLETSDHFCVWACETGILHNTSWSRLSFFPIGCVKGVEQLHSREASDLSGYGTCGDSVFDVISPMAAMARAFRATPEGRVLN